LSSHSPLVLLPWQHATDATRAHNTTATNTVLAVIPAKNNQASSLLSRGRSRPFPERNGPACTVTRYERRRLRNERTFPTVRAVRCIGGQKESQRRRMSAACRTGRYDLLAKSHSATACNTTLAQQFQRVHQEGKFPDDTTIQRCPRSRTPISFLPCGDNWSWTCFPSLDPGKLASSAAWRCSYIW
jgi:hypothetical protein